MITCNSEALLLKAMQTITAAKLKRLAIFYCFLRSPFKNPVKGPNLNVVRFVSFSFFLFCFFVNVFVILLLAFLLGSFSFVRNLSRASGTSPMIGRLSKFAVLLQPSVCPMSR